MRSEKWIYIRIRKFVVEIHFTTNTNKNEKQTNKQKERKIKQAYAKIDLHLDDS